MKSVEFLDKSIPWYKKWWGILLIVIICLVTTFLPFFFFELYGAIQAIKAGTYIDPSVFEENAPYQMAQIVDSMSPSTGAEDAPIVIVEFGDFNCPYCLDAVLPLKKVMMNYGDKVKLYWRNFPATKETSLDFALASVCAKRQEKFWPFHNVMFANQGKLSVGNLSEVATQVGIDVEAFELCMKNSLTEAQVKKDYFTATDNDVAGTPTFYINGFKVQGPITYETWQELIEKILPIYD